MLISNSLQWMSRNAMQVNSLKNCIKYNGKPNMRQFSNEKAQPKSSLTKRRFFMIGGATFGATILGPYLWTKLMGSRVSSEAIYTNQIVWDSLTRKTKSVKAPTVVARKIPQELIDKMKISRNMSGNMKIPGMTLTLLQYQTCPFCCKVRAFLDYFGIPYNVVEVNPVLRQQLKFSKYKKVPILIVSKDNEELALQLNDSTTIISVLTSYLMHNPSLTQSLESILKMYENVAYTRLDDKNKINEVINRYFIMYGEHSGEKDFKDVDKILSEERKWRHWTDDIFVHALSPNIYRTMEEALKSFKYFSDAGKWEEVFPSWERNLVIYVGATAMYGVSKRLKKKYNLKDDVRQSLYDLCRQWIIAIGPDRKFMGGDKPNLADLAIFGSLSSIEGCAAFQDLINQNGKIRSWYYSVKENCKNHTGSEDIRI